MTAAAPVLENFDEDAWDDLLNFIEERRVIPINGPDLLRVQTDRGLRPLYEYLAEKLAARLSVDHSVLPQPLTLNNFYCYGILATGTLRTQAGASFLPQLLIDPFYWRGWLENIHLVLGYAVFILALLGVLLLRKGLPRLFMIGLWAGYVLFCLVFNYHIATHDYYHLQLIPIVALSLGPMAGLIYERLRDLNHEWYWRLTLWLVMLLALGLALNSARFQLAGNAFMSKVMLAEEIGERVQHSTSTVYLASAYGLSLEYHGELSGEPWPLVSDLEWERLAGVTVMDAEQRFTNLFAFDSPDYFIVLDLGEFDQQIDLKEFLTRNYPVISRSEHYIIFDLQRRQ